MKKLRVLAVLAIVLILSITCLTTNAQAASTVARGSCGDNLTWTLDSDGGLKIYGTGAMYDYNYLEDIPWYSYRESIQTVVIQSGVTTIGMSAFYGCNNLTNIAIPDSVTRIGNRAFCECYSLTGVYLPNGLTSIGMYAFEFCNSLTSVIIPSSVTEINIGAFAQSHSLTDIYVDSGNQYYTSVSGVLYSKDKSQIVGYPSGRNGAYDIPYGVTKIVTSTFCGCQELTGITIPSSVTSIGDFAFWDCESITGFVIPSSVTDIGTGAFRYCDKKLSSVVFMGDKPNLGDDLFFNVRTTVYYPANNTTWSDVQGQNFGGTITWKTHDRVELKITTQPKTAYAKSGSTVKTTLKAEGDGLTYQWYIRNADQSKYSKSSVTSATYSCKMSSTTKDRRAYCVITDQYGNSVKSNTVVMRMAATITTQPKSAAAYEGSTAKVTVKATGDGLKYQWYVKNAGKDSFSKSSITKATYSVEMSDKADGRKVYCVVTDKYGKTAKSDTVTLTMKTPLKITTQPKSVAVEEGVTAKVTVKATGDGLKYQWYIKNAGKDSFSKSSVTKSTYSVEMSDKADGRKVYCVVTDKYGETVKSNTVTLTMKTPLTITTQPKSVAVEKGETAKVTVKATGDGLKYQWYVKNKGADSFSKSSITKSTYSVEMSDKADGRKVYCVVTDKYGKTAKSDTATLTMKVSFEITSQPKSVRVDKGETAKVTVKATGNDLTYTWYYMNAGQTKFSKSSVTKSTYSVEMSNKVSGRQIYCVVKDASGKKLQTNTVILNITGGPEITTQPKKKTVAAGKSVTLSVDAEGKGLTYEWYFKDPKDSEYRLSAAISNDPSTYSFLMLEKMDGRKVFCVITDSSGRKTTSKTITIKLA